MCNKTINSIFRLLFSILTLALVSGCATHWSVADEKLKAGMSKGEVLEIMGEYPSIMGESDEKGIERWTYIDRIQGMFEYVELKFKDGKYESWRFSGSTPIGGGYNPFEGNSIQQMNQNTIQNNEMMRTNSNLQMMNQTMMFGK